MKTHPARTLLFGLVMASLVCVGTASAFSYTVSGVGPMQFPGELVVPPDAPWGPNGYPGDTVELLSYSGTLDIQVGVYSYVQKINSLHWIIDYTYGGPNEPWDDMLFDFNTDRTMTTDVGNVALHQDGRLRVNYYNDYLSLFDGLATSFVIDGYKVDVTPLGLGPWAGENFDGGNPWVQPDQDVMARFDISEVPEPTTMMTGSLLLSLLGAAKLMIRRKRNS